LLRSSNNRISGFTGKKMLGIAPGILVLAIALGLVPLLAFAWERGGAFWPDAYALKVLRFTVLQASLSTFLSVVPAIFVARAFARQRFLRRGALLALFGVPLSLPVIVAIFGLTSLYGPAGIFGGWVNLYGLGGILLAHVFFNLPLATRLLLESLEASPSDNHRLAAQLRFSDTAVFRHVDWPALKPALPRVTALIFLLCASSFIVVLLFGGPQATTLEVAIYQSLRMDFDVTRALTLTVMQILLSAVLVWVAAKALVMPQAQAHIRITSQRFDSKSLGIRCFDTMVIGAAALLVVPVLFSIAVQGATHLSINTALLKACGTSVLIAVCTSCISLPLAWGMAHALARIPAWRGVLTGISLVGFIVPPAVIATGWFLAFRSFDAGIPFAIFLIAVMNSLMALPFLMTVLGPAVARSIQQNDRLCEQLNVQGWNRFTQVDVPSMRGPLAQALFMTVVLSMGDLTAVTLLGTQGLLTLPSLVQQQMGHYQSEAAGGTALVLAFICLIATFAAQRVSRWT
jgi:thiamine transport system permease protein